MINQCKLIFCIFLLLSFKTPDFTQDAAYIHSDNIEYNSKYNFLETTSPTNALTKHYVFDANQLLYDIKQKQLWLDGSTVHDSTQKRFNAHAMYYDMQNNYMYMNNIAADLGDNNLMVARSATSFNQNHLQLENTIFTPCKLCETSRPIWSIAADKVTLDKETQNITYKNAKFRVYNVPVFFTPYFSHPQPNAPARSGLLIPNFHHGTFNVPYYWRIASNMDAIFQPRFANDVVIYQGQFRHLLPSGRYKVDGSYSKVPMTKTKDKTTKIIKQRRNSSYHIKTDSLFLNDDGSNYGANLDLVSDKLYLKKYYNRYDSFLTSTLFLNKTGANSYINVQALYFQNFFNDDALGKNSLASPEITYKKFWQPFDSANDQIVLKNDFLNYHAREKIDLLKNSLTLTWQHHNITPGGNYYSITAYDKLDLYLRHMNSANIHPRATTHLAMSRNIPEIHMQWRNPYILPHENSVLVEPRVQVILSRNQHKDYDKFRTIGHKYYEISHTNLYNSNRFATSDFHEFGTRANYGVTAYFPTRFASIQTFLGEAYYLNAPSTEYRNQIVGSTSINFPYGLYLSHEFNKLHRQYRSMRDEINVGYEGKKLSSNISYFEQRPMDKIFNEYNLIKIKQANIGTTLHMTSNLDFKNNFRIDFVQNNKARLLIHTMQVTYLMDCVSIHAKFTNDRTIDKSRAITRTNDISFTVGLKTINM